MLELTPTVIDSYSLWVGIGSTKGTPCSVITAAVAHVFTMCRLADSAIAAICTIDHKVSDPGLVEFCRDRQLPLRGFSAEALRAVIVPNPSAIASRTLGTPSVAEAAAMLAAHQEWVQRTPEKAISAACQPSLGCWPSRCASTKFTSLLPSTSLLIPKQIFRLSNQPGAVTLAVAGNPQWFSELI